jgi:hypothetical protein
MKNLKSFFEWVHLKWASICQKKEASAAKTVEEVLGKTEKMTCISSEDYLVDEKDKNLFYNRRNQALSIRILKSSPKLKKRDKDQLIFASSLPHKFCGSTSHILMASVPQLVSVDYSKSHELLITKSAASNFADLEDSILKFLFFYLNREHNWTIEEQPVLIMLFRENGSLDLYFKVETFRHLELGRALCDVEGISNGTTMLARINGRYEISLYKSKLFDWKNILPKIKEVIINYFPGGVKFTEDIRIQ